MKERINIVSHPSGAGFSIPFLNGNIDIPDSPGGYCISSGCGSGKTEACKSIIRNKFNEGILYAVDTISECEKMYQWVKEELVDNGIINNTDVMMINSKAPLESMKTYLDNPEKICHVKILIVVQVRFFVELINYFLIFNPMTPPDSFDGDFQRLMNRVDIRKFVIFDETPLFLKPFASLTKGEIAPFATYRAGKWTCKPQKDIEDVYNKFIKGDIKMDYNNGNNTMSRVKNSVVLKAIPKNFDKWMAKKEKKFEIQYMPSDLIHKGMTSYVLVFEGAGDILIGTGSIFKLLDVKNKYNSKIEFHKFEFKLNRKQEPNKAEYDEFVNSIEDILKKVNGKTLIVIWKDFKAEHLSEIQNDKYTKKLEDRLFQDGFVSSFAVTYYGASDTKSCNNYRDYENIILAGKWGLVTSVTQKLKHAFLCKSTCMENYMMWYYVQLLLRIGIRNNSNGQFHVYYSSDHKQTFMDRLNIYLNNNIFISTPISVSKPLWEVIICGYKKGSYYLKDIEKLADRDPKIKDAIEACQPYCISIPLKEIGNLIKKKKKLQVDNYRYLVNFLAKLGITLKIIR